MVKRHQTNRGAIPRNDAGLRVFFGRSDLTGAKERRQPDGLTGEGVHSALLPIHHADRRPALEAGRPELLHGLDRGAPGGHDILDETDALAGLEGTLEHTVGSITLRPVSNDQEGQPGCKRGGSGERDGAELGARQPVGPLGTLADKGCDPLAELAQSSGSVSNRYLSR